MEKQYITIGNIPALLWGPESDRLFIAVHGDASHKEDTVIRLLAEAAVAKGYRALSFDLPEHGDRKAQPRPCKARECAEDLGVVMGYARALSDDIGLFGCSMGAYFGMLACGEEPIRRALFLSPVVDMAHLIENMMGWFDVSAEQLEREQAVETPIKTLYWDYYRYVLDHPIRWDKPTALLYGDADTLCEPDVVQAFATCCGADLTTLEGGEHFFHTEEQLAFYTTWLEAWL